MCWSGWKWSRGLTWAKTAHHRRFTDHHTHHHDVSVDVNETVEYFTDRFPWICSMNLEGHDDCNIVSMRTSAKEHVIWMLYLDQVHCNSVFKNKRLKNRYFHQCGKSGLRAFYMNIGFNDSWQFQYYCGSVVRCLIFVNINYSHVVHIMMPFMNIVRSFVHAFMLVCLRSHVNQWGIASMLLIMLVKNEPPFGESWLRACYELAN